MDAPASTSPRRPSAQGWLLAGLLVFFAGLCVQYARKAAERDGSRTAILRWREQLLSLQDGEDIYQRYTYPNPPVMALLLLPLASVPEDLGLPPLAGALAWFWLKVGMTLLVFRWVFRMLESAGRPFPLWAKALAVLLSLRPIAGDLSHGNVNLFILFLVVAGLYAFHNGRDFLAGLVLALATACKVTPGLFLAYLIWKRAWHGVAGFAAGIALFLWPGVVPGLCLGWEENLQQTRSWYEQMVKPFVLEGLVTSEHNNQSLPGLVYRLLTDSPSFSAYPNNVYTPTRYDNFLSLSPGAARWLVKGFMALFVLLVAWACRTPRDGPGSPGRAWLVAEYSVVVVGMLLFSERTWKHHCVTLFLPFAVLAYFLALDWRRSGRRAYLAGTLAAVVLLMSTTSTSLLGKQGGKMAQVYGAYVWAFFLLLAALAHLLRGSDRPAVAGPAEAGDKRPGVSGLRKAG
jgi:alpha-1,2-mannosyltransferase